MPRRESALDAKLRQLGALQELTQKGQESAASTNLADIKGLTDLYGISQQQQKTPAELAQMAAQTEMLKAHAGYYTERPEEMKARGIEHMSAALRSMYDAGLPKEAIESQAREWGLLPAATAITPQAQKSTYAPGVDVTKPLAATPTPTPNLTQEQYMAMHKMTPITGLMSSLPDWLQLRKPQPTPTPTP